MDVLGLCVQTLDGNNLYLLNHTLSQNQSLLISRHFYSFITQLKSDDLGPNGPKSTPPNVKSGSALIMQQYRVLYTLVYEVYVFIILHETNNPYFFVPMLTRAKRLLVSACKGTEVSASQLSRKFSEVYFGLERVIHNEDAAEGVSQKILESTPYAPGPSFNIGYNISGKIFDGSTINKGPLPVLNIEESQPEPVQETHTNPTSRQFFTYNPRRMSIGKHQHDSHLFDEIQNPKW